MGSRLFALWVCVLAGAAVGEAIEAVRSTEDLALALAAVEAPVWGAPADAGGAEDVLDIEIDPSKTYQSILGIGGSLEHATCYNLSKLGEAGRVEVIEKLMHPEQGIGMNLMRLCIGTSDFVGEPWYTYCDTPDNAPDPELKHFSIEKDRAYVLPAIKAAQAANPELLFFASPWSPPAWMKTNGKLLGGAFKPEHYGAYATYFVRFLEAYRAEGIPICALTGQNEPHFPNPEYTTCAWTGAQQRDFFRDHLGPALRGAGFDTPLWCWDHNWNTLDFARAVLEDPGAAQYVAGTGFHLYEGEVEAQSALKAEFPDKDILFTEGSVFRTVGAKRIIDILRNWSRTYNCWVMMLDEQRKPNNGPHTASETCIVLMDDGSVKYSYDYYMMGQFSKYIVRGSVRLESSGGDRFAGNAAFRRPDGKTVLVVANASRTKDRELRVRCGGREFRHPLPQRSVTTYVW